MDFGNANWGQLGRSAGSIFGGLFGDSGAPYEDYENELRKYLGQVQNYQNPYFNAGKNALPQFDQWTQGMSDPSQFINNLMGKYQESPWAKYQQKQSIRAAQNAGSRGDMNVGGLNSTPWAQFVENNARDISSQDMMGWLQQVLGINSNYGNALNSTLNRGQHAGDTMTNYLSDYGRQQAIAKYSQRAGENQDRNNLWGGIFNAGAAIAPVFF